MCSGPKIEPDRVDRTFRISCNFFERNFVLPKIVKSLRDAAPLARLTVLQAGTDGLRQINEGLADLLIGPMREETEHQYCRTLFRDEYVCVMDPAHQLASVTPSLDDLLNSNMVEVSYGEEWTSDYLVQLNSLARERKQAIVKVPSPGDVQRIIQGTDLIAIVPRLYAQTLEPNLHVTDLPFASSLQVDLVWTTRTHGSAVHKWFRDLVADAVRKQAA